MLLNSVEALQQHLVVSNLASQHLPQAVDQLEQQLHVLEAELVKKLEQHYVQEIPLLCSITGVGHKTAAALLLFAKGFTQAENYWQLIAKKLFKLAGSRWRSTPNF